LIAVAEPGNLGITSRPMSRLVLALIGTAFLGCGPSYSEGQGAKSPDEIVAEQEALAAQQEKLGKDPNDYAAPETTEDEKRRQWDQPFADMKIARPKPVR
jgi:hypothetical protein